jgi:hypothetical protein
MLLNKSISARLLVYCWCDLPDLRFKMLPLFKLVMKMYYVYPIYQKWERQIGNVCVYVTMYLSNLRRVVLVWL